MIRLIVVEDERIIRNGLEKHVRWKELGIDEVRFAANSEEAFRICQDFAPDIITSDIRMPGMDGIEMCRRLRQSFPDSEIIFITGHADKEYLKAAIELHAVRYVEKPVRIDEYSDAVKEALRLVTKTIKQQAGVLRELTGKMSAEPFRASGSREFFIGILHTKESEDMALLAKTILEEMNPVLKRYGLRLLTEGLSDNRLGLLVGSRQAGIRDDRMRDISETIQNCMGERKWFLSFGSAITDTRELSVSLEEAQSREKMLSYLGWNHTVFADKAIDDKSHQYQPEEGIKERFEDSLTRKHYQSGKKVLEDFLQILKEKEAFMNREIRQMYLEMEQKIEWSESLLWPGRAKSNDSEFLEHAETFDEMHVCLSEKLKNLLGDQLPGKNSFTVKTVTDYIRDNYASADLSIADIADQAGLTPTYLSNLFKKCVGMTIGQYILDVRIGHAKELMEQKPWLKFYEIADQVGYEDANYFAKIFKKSTGYTPSEYKERLLLK